MLKTTLLLSMLAISSGASALETGNMSKNKIGEFVVDGAWSGIGEEMKVNQRNANDELIKKESPNTSAKPKDKEDTISFNMAEENKREQENKKKIQDGLQKAQEAQKTQEATLGSSFNKEISRRENLEDNISSASDSIFNLLKYMVLLLIPPIVILIFRQR